MALDTADSGVFRNDIKEAIGFKELALDRIPIPGDSGCTVEQWTSKEQTSVKTGDCKKPVNTITYQFPQPTAFTGYSLLPDKRRATCKQRGDTTSCKINPPLKPFEQFWADFQPPAAKPGMVTTAWKPPQPKAPVGIESQKPVTKTPTTTPGG